MSISTMGVEVVNATFCLQCQEEPEFGTPLELSDELRLLAAAQRAQNDGAAIRCLAAPCTNEAREWWYVCSRECRDRLVKEHLPK